MKRIALALVALGLFSLGAFVISLDLSTAPQHSVGATNTNQLIGGFPYFLAGSGISSSATSIILTSFTLPQTGYEILTSDLAQPFYLTLEPGNTSKQEFISCTTVAQNASNSTATLSGCTRGLLPIAPYTSNSSYAFSHTGGTTAILSNSPQFYNQFLILGNAATSTNTLVFSSTSPPYYDNPGAQSTGSYIYSTSEFASVAYVNAIAFGGPGIINGTTGARGVYQSSTALQAASTTLLGSSGASLALTSATATDTPQRGCAVGYTGVAGAGCDIFADLTGHIKQVWLTFADALATTTFAGGIVGESNYQDFTTSGTWTKPGQISGNEQVYIQVWGGGAGGGSCTWSGGTCDGGGGGGGSYNEAHFAISQLTTTVSVTVGAAAAGGTTAVASGAGATNSFGSYVTAYGGGSSAAGINNNSNSGSGGGGILGAGGTGTTVGSSPAGGIPLSATSTMATSTTFGGGTGQPSSSGIPAQSSVWGGGGGGCGGATACAGGNSVYGGGGGAGGGNTGSTANGGNSVYGGRGGASCNGSACTGTAGAVPAGGGGSCGDSTAGASNCSGGAGGRGEVRVWVYR